MNQTPNRWAVVWAVALPLAVLSVDFGGASVALPSIGEDLDVGASSLTWVLNAFALGAAAPLIVAGRVADRIGRRRVLLSGLVVFTVATVLCGVAPTFEALVVGRAAQGIGTALFMAPSLGVLVAAFRDPFRTRAIGVWSAAGGAALAGGPIVGGLLTEFASWRWFFLVNIPILLAAMVMVLGWVSESRDPEASRVDPTAAVAVTSAIAFLLLAVQVGTAQGWGSAISIACWVGLGLSVGLLVWRERGPAAPIVDRAIVRSRNYRRASAVAFLANWGFGAANFLLTLYLQDILGWSAFETGLAFLLYSVPFALVGFTIGRITNRLGLTGPLTAGMLLVTASFLLFALVGAAGNAGPALVGLAVAGVGQGLAFNLSTTSSMGSVPDTVGGVASGVLTTLRNVGIVFGVSVATLVAEAVGGELPQSVSPGEPVSQSAADAFTDGLAAASLVIAGVSLVGAFIARQVR